MSMEEVRTESVHLMVTSPPYFNAPFDYKGLFKSYDQYLELLRAFARETYRVLQDGRIAVLNIDDMLVDGEKYPIVADATKIFQEAGFRYRDRIIWKKPDGYLRISRRSGVILQNPYPMYFYPDNLLESIVIFQKGRFNYRSVPRSVRERSRVSLEEIQDNKWYMTLWEMNNVMPGSPLEKDIAAFPLELPYRAIKLFSYQDEIVLDPFAGSGTTMHVARGLGRHSIGIEINKGLVPIIKKKTGFEGHDNIQKGQDTLEVIIRPAGTYGPVEGELEMDVAAEIKRGIVYRPLMCSQLESYDFDKLEDALAKSSAFLLDTGAGNNVAISSWVSAKRTRSYPYARVYNTLNCSGKKITVIPIFKDEGQRGDRDFLQWDTVSLMSLLGVHVIIGYYVDADLNPRYPNKITNQRFDASYVRSKISEILSYHSDPLHWNLAQVDDVGHIAQKALESYDEISSRLNVQMHSRVTAERRIRKLKEGRDAFIPLSRSLAQAAQERESETEQPKEFVAGSKATVTIKNYIGGLYHLTADEFEIHGDDIHLIEAKHSRRSLPSIDDIKDGLIKMMLFSNIENVSADGKDRNPVAVLKLTSGGGIKPENLSTARREQLESLQKEAEANGFSVRFE